MPLFLLTVRGVFTKQLSARWAIVQLAGRRILVPLIVVQVHVAQPTRTQTSPSSSRPRTAAFHAVNSGSNPLGDANRHLKAHHIPQKLRFCGAPFYYKHPALVKPSLPALKPLRSLQPRHVLRPSGKNSPYVQKLRALPVQGVTSVMKMAPSSGKRMACAPHCFSLPTGCTRLLWPRLKAHLPASSPPPSRFSRLYTIPCRYSPWHKAEIHRPR